MHIKYFAWNTRGGMSSTLDICDRVDYTSINKCRIESRRFCEHGSDSFGSLEALTVMTSREPIKFEGRPCYR